MSKVFKSLKEVRERFFPNYKECSCGGFHPKKEMTQCRKCKEYLCLHCVSKHAYCIPKGFNNEPN